MNNFFWLQLVVEVVLTIAALTFAVRLDVERRRVKVLNDVIKDAEGVIGTSLISPMMLGEFLEKHGFSDPRKPGEVHFMLEDNELDNLINLSVDMCNGRANMDTALWWSRLLENVLMRLKKGDGVVTPIIGEEVSMDNFTENSVMIYEPYLCKLNNKWQVAVFTKKDDQMVYTVGDITTPLSNDSFQRVIKLIIQE